jgi:GDP-L-fucose synthase
MMNTTDKVYVAGNTGLVGSALVRNLHAQGYHNQVYTPFPEWDMRRQDQAEMFLGEQKPDVVIIAAAKVGGILANNTYPAEFIYDNLMIAANLVEASFRAGVRKLLFLGSSCIYPRLCPQPIVEDYLLTGSLEQTNEAYAIAKIAGLKLCAFYRRQYGVDYISAMPTNLFGIGDNFNLKNSHVLPAMIRKCHLAELYRKGEYDMIVKDMARFGESVAQDRIESILGELGIVREGGSVTLKLWGTGTPRREFLYSDDLADALIYLLNHYSGEQHVNVGTGVDLTIRELAEMVQRVVRFEGSLGWDSTKPDGTPQKLLDVSKLHDLGWKEKMGLEEGIRQVYQWYNQHA